MRIRLYIAYGGENAPEIAFPSACRGRGIALAGDVQAAELLIFERDGCVWCQRWHRDVGSSYGKTDEARVLPLRRVNIDTQATSRVRLVSPVRYTPTFVVVDDGREIGRITGYINDDAFWGLLEHICDQD